MKIKSTFAEERGEETKQNETLLDEQRETTAGWEEL